MRFFNKLITEMFYRDGCKYKLARYSHQLGASLLKFARNNERENVLKICKTYPFIINHCSMEKGSPFPLSVLIKNNDVQLTEFFLANGASTRLIRTTESQIHMSPHFEAVDNIRDTFNECSDGSLKSKLEEHFALETAALAIKQSFESTSPEEIVDLLFKTLTDPSVRSLMHIPICDGYAFLNYDHPFSCIDRVTGIPTNLSLKEFLISKCNELPEDKRMELSDKLGNKFEFDFGTHISQLHI